MLVFAVSHIFIGERGVKIPYKQSYLLLQYCAGAVNKRESREGEMKQASARSSLFYIPSYLFVNISFISKIFFLSIRWFLFLPLFLLFSLPYVKLLVELAMGEKMSVRTKRGVRFKRVRINRLILHGSLWGKNRGIDGRTHYPGRTY